MSGGAVRLAGLTKQYGDVAAVDGIDLDVAEGEFFSLLGPSGCGKTTTLRLIAGFERPTAGAIFIDNVHMETTPPHRRPVSTVFQSYALFPHMSVGQNIAFGLRYLDLPKTEMDRRTGRVLELTQLTGLEDRKPTQLSGGQQQRVALARSLILNPSVLLLDEPLGALDAKLRKALQVELKALQEEVGVTFIYVTHDQEEALTMSDRLAVMSEGHIEQVGTPEELYEEPANTYIADFLGLSNLLPATVVGSAGNGCLVRIGPHVLRAAAGATSSVGDVNLCVRPERVVLGGGADNELPGVIDRVVYVGPFLHVLVHVAGVGEIQAVMQNQGNRVALARGQAIHVGLPPEALRVLAHSPLADVGA